MFKAVKRTLRSAAMASVVIAACAAQPALATNATGDLDVSATVTANCNVSTVAVAFGNVDVTNGQDVPGTGSFSVTCTNGTGWTASADSGAGTGASLAVRKMSSGSNLLNYALFTDSQRTALWGDGATGSSTFGGTGSGVAQANTIYGLVPGGQTGVPAGSYADTVVVTVTY